MIRFEFAKLIEPERSLIRWSYVKYMLIYGLILIGVSCLSSGLKAQDDQEESKVPKTKWSTIRTQEFRIDEDVVIQTYQVQRNSKQDQPTPASRLIRLDSMNPSLKLSGTEDLNIFSGRLPYKNGGQIIVEMKKVNEDKKDRAIGVFAPNSWILAENGKVELFNQNLKVDNRFREKKYWIGVRCQEIVTREAKNQTAELVVEDVVDQGAAQLAGLQANDVVLRWNGQPLGSVTRLVHSIQTNGDKKAAIQIRRSDREMELEITPQAKIEEVAQVRTVIVPAASSDEARKKIDELEELVELDGSSQQVRVLWVGPGVNFGREEIELQVSPDMPSKKIHLKKLLDRVAEKKYGVFVNDNTFTLKSSPESLDSFEDFDFEPDEIWDTMQFGVDGKTFNFRQLAPRMIHQAKVEMSINVARQTTKDLAKKIKTGQIVFPSVLSPLRKEIQQEIELLKLENEKIREQNRSLKKALEKLSKEFKK